MFYMIKIQISLLALVLLFGCGSKKSDLPNDLKISVIHTNEEGVIDAEYHITKDTSTLLSDHQVQNF